MDNRPPGRRAGVPATVLRGPFDPGGQPELTRPNHLHLSLFAWNVRNGLSASKIVMKDPDRYQDFWKWPSAKRLLQATEAAGFDSQLQYGMWSGYGGATGWNDSHLDFATAAATSAAVTERLGIISTMHVGYRQRAHSCSRSTAPYRLARCCATPSVTRSAPFWSTRSARSMPSRSRGHCRPSRMATALSPHCRPAAHCSTFSVSPPLVEKKNVVIGVPL